jgi:predicted PurR-regulated permease PerM
MVDALQKGVGGTIRTLWQTLSFILGMIIIPFWLFYVLNDQAKGHRAFYRLVPERAREDMRCIEEIMDGLLSAYVRGQLLLCVLVGALATIALLLLGVDLAILLGTFAGIFEIVPILGPYIGAVPAVLIALLKRPILGLWVALAFAAIQQLENIFLVPRISGNAVRFHPAVVMVIVIIGAEVAGLWGLLLAVPLTAMLRDVFRYLYLRTTDKGATPQMAMENLRARNL